MAQRITNQQEFVDAVEDIAQRFEELRGSLPESITAWLDDNWSFDDSFEKVSRILDDVADNARDDHDLHERITAENEDGQYECVESPRQ